MMPPRYNSNNPGDDWNRANRRLFNIEKNQGSSSLSSSPATTSFKPTAHAYTVDTGTAIPKLDESINQAESYILEIEEMLYEWGENHRSQFERRGLTGTRTTVQARNPRLALNAEKMVWQNQAEAEVGVFTPMRIPPYTVSPNVQALEPPPPSTLVSTWMSTTLGKGVTPSKKPKEVKEYEEALSKFDSAKIADEKSYKHLIAPNIAKNIKDARDHDEKILKAYRAKEHAYNTLDQRAVARSMANLPRQQRLQIEREDVDFENAHPDPTHGDYVTRNGTVNRYFEVLLQLEPQILKAVAKLLTIIHTITSTYKNKVSGMNLNRIEPTDMNTIRSLIEAFIVKCQKLSHGMEEQKKLIVDSETAIIARHAPLQLVNVKYRHNFDIVEKQYIGEINKFVSLYKSDQQRYSYNYAKR